jgi:hypothetical protein
MADGTITEAVQSGQNIRVTATIDEGLAGMHDYTVELSIADLKALGSQAARTAAITAALVAERDRTLQHETIIERYLAQMLGKPVTL